MNPRGTRTIEDPKTGIRVDVSRPAQNLIGPGNVNKFVKLLMGLMDALSTKEAYVSKAGDAVEIHILGHKGWTFHIDLKREP